MESCLRTPFSLLFWSSLKTIIDLILKHFFNIINNEGNRVLFCCCLRKADVREIQKNTEKGLFTSKCIQQQKGKAFRKHSIRKIVLSVSQEGNVLIGMVAMGWPLESQRNKTPTISAIFACISGHHRHRHLPYPLNQKVAGLQDSKLLWRGRIRKSCLFSLFEW